MKLLLSKILLCTTHRRFKRIFDKLERQGYDLFIREGHLEDPNHAMKVRRYTKNVKKAVELYNRFTG